jgi:hypothetical protein
MGEKLDCVEESKVMRIDVKRLKLNFIVFLSVELFLSFSCLVKVCTGVQKIRIYVTVLNNVYEYSCKNNEINCISVLPCKVQILSSVSGLKIQVQ